MNTSFNEVKKKSSSVLNNGNAKIINNNAFSPKPPVNSLNKSKSHNSNVVQQNSNGVQQNSNGVQQNSNGVQQNSNGVQQNSNVVQQNSKSIHNNTNNNSNKGQSTSSKSSASSNMWGTKSNSSSKTPNKMNYKSNRANSTSSKSSASSNMWGVKTPSKKPNSPSKKPNSPSKKYSFLNRIGHNPQSTSLFNFKKSSNKISSKNASSKNASYNNASSKNASSKNASSKNASSKNASSKNASYKNASSKNSSINDKINNLLGNKSAKEQSTDIKELSSKKGIFHFFDSSTSKDNKKSPTKKSTKEFLDSLYTKSKSITKPLNKIVKKDGQLDFKKTAYNYFILLLIGVFIAILLYVVIFAIYYHQEKCHEKKVFGDYLKGFNVDSACNIKVKPNTDEQDYKERKKLKEKEVYHISNQNLTYDEAKCKCEAYKGKLATKKEIIDAYNKGAEWCTYGWSEGQNAFYPTQKCTWDELQEGPKKDRNKCGKPGINGGYFASPDIKFGANCYGIKPEGDVAKPKKPFCKKKAFCKRSANKDSATKLDSDDISGFNTDKWSEYD